MCRWFASRASVMPRSAAQAVNRATAGAASVAAISSSSTLLKAAAISAALLNSTAATVADPAVVACCRRLVAAAPAAPLRRPLRQPVGCWPAPCHALHGLPFLQQHGDSFRFERLSSWLVQGRAGSVQIPASSFGELHQQKTALPYCRNRGVQSALMMRASICRDCCSVASAALCALLIGVSRSFISVQRYR